MRLWSIHPRYLDSKGLVALWREALLAQKVLAGMTLGYRHHPQLERFKEMRSPLNGIGRYLASVADEAEGRGYSFDRSKIIATHSHKHPQLKVTSGQLAFEWEHLRSKLRQRDPVRLLASKKVKYPKPHPLFKKVRGKVETWERNFPDRRLKAETPARTKRSPS